jgi:hypothetical protein
MRKMKMKMKKKRKRKTKGKMRPTSEHRNQHRTTDTEEQNEVKRSMREGATTQPNVCVGVCLSDDVVDRSRVNDGRHLDERVDGA